MLNMTTPPVQANANTQGPNNLRVMTYNILLDNPADGAHTWPNRKELVASVIRFHKADIIVYKKLWITKFRM